ncbi:hypothetical protein [Yoonia sp.]|uniref:hypothetical protein n=1 Tax=Yoonia sp. TaxID=2212373 RepID=UPI00358F5140
MADSPKNPTLSKDLREAFGSVYFAELSGSQRNKAISNALSALDDLTRKEVTDLVESVRAQKISVENAREALVTLIVAGKVMTDDPKPATKAKMKAAVAVVEKAMVADHGKVNAAIRTLGKVASPENEAEAAPFIAEVTTVATAAENETGDQSPDAEEEPPVVVNAPAPNPGEDQTMFTFEELLQEIDTLFAFDESKLPARLRYDTSGTTRSLSLGQIAFLRGVAEAIDKQGARRPDVPQAVRLVAVVGGMLLVDGYNDPDNQSFYGSVMDILNELNAAADPSHGEVGNATFESEFTLKRDVFIAATDIILNDDNGGGGVFLDAVASVGREMVDIYDSVKPLDRGFTTAVRARYGNQTLKLGGGSGGGSGVAFLDLPPLNEPGGGSNEVVRENIQSIASIYVVYQCEQMMLFQTTDRIVELFMAGLLPMKGDSAARALDDYYWDRDEKVSPNGRSAQYTRALGAAGGDVGADVTPNTEFNSLLMRVVSSVSEYERQNAVGNLLDNTGRRAQPTSGEYVRKAVRDLAANCTLYGFAGVQFAAERMVRQLKAAMRILELPRVREIYGVTSMWQVIERVAQSEFGTTVNVVKHRTMAEEVRKMLEVIAEKPDAWSVTTGRPLFHHMDSWLDTINSDLSPEQTAKFFRAAQYFLAVNGVHGDQVYEYSQPVDTPALPSIPGMGTWGGMGQQPQQAPGAASAMPIDPAGGLQNMAASGRAPGAADIRSVVPSLI